MWLGGQFKKLPRPRAAACAPYGLGALRLGYPRSASCDRFAARASPSGDPTPSARANLARRISPRDPNGVWLSTGRRPLRSRRYAWCEAPWPRTFEIGIRGSF